MREILFRGKRFDSDEWVVGFLARYIPFFETANIVDEFGMLYVVSTKTVGQYTGIVDINGVKIFEGDIVKGYNAMGKNDIDMGVVNWDELFVEWQTGECQKMYGNSGIRAYEVIGNIYDNPELVDEVSKDGIQE